MNFAKFLKTPFIIEQLWWLLHTSAWLFSSKFAAYFQNTFSQEHIWTAASEISKLISLSHHYAQLGNALQKHFFAYSALIMGTLKGSTG